MSYPSLVLAFSFSGRAKPTAKLARIRDEEGSVWDHGGVPSMTHVLVLVHPAYDTHKSRNTCGKSSVFFFAC